MNGQTPTPQEIVRALQYLYYTGDGNNRLKGSPITDRNYDLYCEQHGIPGNGGSDRERDYSEKEVELAEKISKGLVNIQKPNNMNTIHQAKIEGYGSLNFSRQRSGGIEVNLTAPDGGPKTNPPSPYKLQLKDEKPIATLDPEGIDDLIDYLMQFSMRSMGLTLYPMKEVADHEA